MFCDALEGDPCHHIPPLANPPTLNTGPLGVDCLLCLRTARLLQCVFEVSSRLLPSDFCLCVSGEGASFSRTAGYVSWRRTPEGRLHTTPSAAVNEAKRQLPGMSTNEAQESTEVPKLRVPRPPLLTRRPRSHLFPLSLTVPDIHIPRTRKVRNSHAPPDRPRVKATTRSRISLRPHGDRGMAASRYPSPDPHIPPMLCMPTLARTCTTPTCAGEDALPDRTQHFQGDGGHHLGKWKRGASAAHARRASCCKWRKARRGMAGLRCVPPPPATDCHL